jgi:hypothetical protein
VAQFKLIPAGLHFNNALGGVRVKLSDDEVVSLTDTTKKTSQGLGNLAAAILQYYVKAMKGPGLAKLTSLIVQTALTSMCGTMTKKNDQNGNEGIVLEFGYPNIMGDVYGPGRWEYEYPPLLG